jgi:hypothetical protein
MPYEAIQEANDRFGVFRQPSEIMARRVVQSIRNADLRL